MAFLETQTWGKTSRQELEFWWVRGPKTGFYYNFLRPCAFQVAAIKLGLVTYWERLIRGQTLLKDRWLTLSPASCDCSHTSQCFRAPSEIKGWDVSKVTRVAQMAPGPNLVAVWFVVECWWHDPPTMPWCDRFSLEAPGEGHSCCGRCPGSEPGQHSHHSSSYSQSLCWLWAPHRWRWRASSPFTRAHTLLRTGGQRSLCSLFTKVPVMEDRICRPGRDDNSGRGLFLILPSAQPSMYESVTGALSHKHAYGTYGFTPLCLFTEFAAESGWSSE